MANHKPPEPRADTPTAPDGATQASVESDFQNGRHRSRSSADPSPACWTAMRSAEMSTLTDEPSASLARQ